MDNKGLILYALKQIVIEKNKKNAYGLVFIGIPELPLLDLVDSMKNVGDLYISFVGSKEDRKPILNWMQENSLDKNRIGFSSTHAVDIRNDSPNEAVKLAFVWEEEERLHSLIERGYQYIGPVEIIEQIAKIGAQNAKNNPQENLWNALGSESFSPYIDLEGITQYYLEWYGWGNSELNENEPNSINGPRENLYLLNLLPDKELLAKKYVEKNQIIKRLIDNAKTVERIQRADEEDRITVINKLKNHSITEEQKNKYKKDYNSYLRLTRSDYSALKELELSDAIYLLSGKKNADTSSWNDDDDDITNPITNIDGEEDDEGSSNGGNETNNGHDDGDAADDFISGDDDDPSKGQDNDNSNIVTFENLTVSAIKLISGGNKHVLEKLADEALVLLKDGKMDKNTLSIIHETQTFQSQFHPNETAISLNRNFSQKNEMGGIIEVHDIEAVNIINKLGHYLDKSLYYDEVKLKTLLDLLNRTEDIVADFQGEDLLNNHLEIRTELLEYTDLLSVEPLACLLAKKTVREIVTRYIKSYEELLTHLDSNYEKLHRESPEGALYIYKEILSLDTVKIISQEEVSVILTASNPLVLWKYLELANLILKDNGKLPVNDEDLLMREIHDLPEPLLAIYSSENNDTYKKLGFSYRVGSLPVYKSTSIEMSDLSQKSLGSAAVKLASLYPPVKENIRVLLIDPVATNDISKTLRRLIDKYGFKKTTLIIAKTNKYSSNMDLPFDPILKELVFEKKAEIEVIKFQNTGKLQVYLKDKPVHLMGISGERTKNVKLIETEGTKLHPLSVPHKLHVDPLIGNISLRPRSVSSEEDGIKHPFEIYNKVVSEITGNPNSEFSMQETNQTSIQDISSLIPFSQFVITMGLIPEITEDSRLIRLTQNIEQSGDSVYTYYKDSIISRLSSHLKKFNYQPTENGLTTLLNRLQSVGGEGVFSTITEKGVNGFSESGVKGLLGLAVALNWYMNDSVDDKNIVISLDSYLARKWLVKRETGKRSDFLGVRQLQDGSYTIDILEVKGYESTNENDVLDSHAADQLRSIAIVINKIVNKQGDLFTDRRRELLRLQIYRESLQLNIKHDAKWIKVLNSIIDGNTPVSINLMLLEVAFDQNIEVTEKIFEPELEAHQNFSIKRIRFGEKDIQKYLEDYIEKIPDSKKANTEDPLKTKKDSRNESVTKDQEFFETQTENEIDSKLDKDAVSIKDREKEDQIKTDQIQTINNQEINSEISLLMGKQVDWEKMVYWDHRREVENPISNHNIIITGDPGKGKTQTVKGLVHELRKNNVPVLTFDFKDDYVDADFLENEKMEKFDIMVEGLPFNPLVPSVDPLNNKFTAISHIVQIEGILKRVYKLGVQQSTQLRSALREAFVRRGINPNSPTTLEEIVEFPNFQDVFEILKEDEKRNATLIGRLDLLFQIGIFPNTPSINFERLMEGSFTLRLSTLPDPDNEIKSAVAEIIILAVHNYLISKEHPRKLTRAIVLDEAHRVSNSGALLGLMREGRAFGIGMLIATQFPTDIPQNIYGCTETKLFLGNDGVEHAEAAAKKLEGNTSKHNINLLADEIRSMKQFRAVLRNSQHSNVFVDITPYYQRK